MLNDLVNPTTNHTPGTPVAKLARRVLMAASVIIGVGLAGVALARGKAVVEQRPDIVFIVRGQPVMVAQPTVETKRENKELLRNAEPQLAKATIGKSRQVAAVPAVASKRVMMMEVTAYCPCTKCCGPEAQGITASGKPVSYNDGQFVAADRSFAFGTKLTIPGYGDGQAVEVIDRGGAIKGERLDVFFPSHAEALQWGRQTIPVTVED